jgi:phosphatidylglycerol lysyltransferase
MDWVRRYLGTFLTLLVFAVVAVLLYRELRHYSYHDIAITLERIPRSRVWAAVGLTALNYTVLTAYDFLALRAIGRSLAPPKVMFTSFIAYAASNNFGVLLGGSTVRYRLYSLWGFSTVDVVRMMANLSLTFWLGVCGLSGLVFALKPVPIPKEVPLPLTEVQPLGFVLVAGVVAYLIFTAVRRRPVEWRGWDFRFPPLSISLLQTLFGMLDFAIAGTAMYMLLPASVQVDYDQFLAMYMLAIVAGVITHVPGGLGVFELVLLKLIPTSEPNAVLGSILAFRLIYYLAPLLVAGVFLAVNELREQQSMWNWLHGTLSTVSPLVVPRLMSLLTLISGAVLLFSSATPAGHGRLMWLAHLIPLSALELSHFLASIVGMLLLLLSHALQRRIDAAYWLTLSLLGCGIVLSLLKGFDYEEALILAGLLVVFLPARREFYRRGRLFSQPFWPGWGLAVMMVAVAAVGIGLFSFRHVEYSNELWWRFSLHAEAPRSLRAAVAASAILLAYAVARLLRLAAPIRPLPTEAELLSAEEIVAHQPETIGHLALLGDKRLLFSDSRKALLMYGISGRSWVSMGDPLGPSDEIRELAWRFRELVDRHGGWTVFYQVGEERLPLYLDLGLSMLKLGHEAQVPLANFSLEGSQRKDLRQTVNRLERLACRFELVPRQQVPALLPELRHVSDAWLAEKNAREKRFSVGRFQEEYIQRFPVATVRHEGRIVAFANLLQGAGHQELSIDLMRHLPTAPASVMEFLFVELMLWGQCEGYATFNLGMAPLSGLEEHTLAPLWHRVGNFIFQHGEHFYNFEGLRQYKEKFAPEWRAKFIASPGGVALPLVMMNLATLISGGATGLVMK